SLWWLARFAESLEHLRLGAVVRPGLSPVNYHGADTSAYALAYQACCLWHLGFPDQATKTCSRALARADSLNHPYSATTVRLQVVEALLHLDPHLGQQEAEKMIAISAEHGFPDQEKVGKIYRNMAILARSADRNVFSELAALIRDFAESGARLAFAA